MSLESSVEKLTKELIKLNQLLSGLEVKPAEFTAPKNAEELPVVVGGGGAPPPPKQEEDAAPPPPPAKPAAEQMTLQQVNKALQHICTKHFNGDGTPIFEVLKGEYNAASVTDVPEEKWAELVQKVDPEQAS